MRRLIRADIANVIIASSVAGIVSLAGVPLFAQTGAGVLQGTAAFGDWRADRPGTRRLIRPQDIPAPDPAQSASNSVRIVHRTDQKPIVPNGFEVNLFASGLDEPRLIRTAPNGDVFVAESAAGRIRVLRPNGTTAAQPSVFASGLNYPFGIAFYPPGPDPQWVYIGNTNSVVRFPYRSGDTTARGSAETIVPHLPAGGHPRATSCSRRTERQCTYRSAPARTMPRTWANARRGATCRAGPLTIRSARPGEMNPIAPMFWSSIRKARTTHFRDRHPQLRRHGGRAGDRDGVVLDQ